MGCDFQLLGTQPDLKIQEACITFLDEFTFFLRKSGHFGVGVRTSVPEEGLPEETRLLRSDVLLFRPNEEFMPTLREYRGESTWNPELLKGIIVEAGTYFPIPVVFDNSFGGFLCTPTLPGARDEWAEQDAPEDALLLRPGVVTRFHEGTALYYVLAFALKHHYIPNLQIDAEHDKDVFSGLLKTTGWMDNVLNAPEDKLAQVVIDGSWAVQKRFVELTRK
ncbi:MAG TPA: hypothetical protein EYN66_09050 [Myxococcales bacterium]|nr:hypothetical protein [Myxococcales bacterium]